jgi:plastocyanin
MNRILLLALSCLLLVFVAGCGGDDEESGGGAGAGGGAAETTEQQPADAGGGTGGGGKAVSVGMKGIQFDPVDVTVAKGGTVTWTNNEDVAHDVTKETGPGPKFSSGRGDMMQGDTYKQTFKTAGKIEYVCSVHPNMTGTVTVE